MSKSSAKTEEDTLKGGLTKEAFNQLWMPLVIKRVEEAGGVKAFLVQNPELISKLQSFQDASGGRSAQWIHDNCPGMEQASPEAIQASYQKTLSAASSSAADSSSAAASSDIELSGQESSEGADS